jgi:predicted TIM-barrel fold metal-dependent hydrolase
MNIDVTEYWIDSLRFNKEETGIAEELAAWMPHKILDCHAHSCSKEMLLKQEEFFFTRPASTFPTFSLEESCNCQKLFYPDKQVITLRFGFPIQGYDLRGQNEYLLSGENESNLVAAIGLPESLDYTSRMICNKKVRAVKIYPFQTFPPAQTILQFFTPEILALAENADKPIILHLPRPLWQCLEEIVQICQMFPRLKIVLAHAGLCYIPNKSFAKCLDILAVYPNIYMDTAMVPSPEPITEAISKLGSNRVLYGSDEPVNMARWVEFLHPELGIRSIPRYKYHWINETMWKQYGQLAQDTIHNHWKTLLAIRSAISALDINTQEYAKNRIFFENASDLFVPS